MPSIQKCNNGLDKYATKLDTCFSAESLQGRPFLACQEVVCFTAGLKDSIDDYAIDCLQQQIDR
jgi:hypothetical protein